MRSRLLLSTLLLSSAPLWAMPQMPTKPSAADPAMTFEVATIKPSKVDEGLAIQIQGRRFATAGALLVDMLKYAYGLHATQIVGIPEQLRNERFDVLGDPPTETRPSSDQMKAMVRRLITDRFAMRSHTEKRELPVYAMMVAKGGAKLSASIQEPGFIPSVALKGGQFSADNAGTQDIATFLQRYVMDRPVVDRTGISGRFHVSVAWTPDGTDAGVRDLPGFYTAMEEQLGLKLEATKAPVDVLVIDHVEQPSDN